MSLLERTRPIGGYFEWEFPPQKDFILHKNTVLLNSGRHALEYILRGLGNVSCVHIPYYTCDAILLPIKRLNLSHSFYSIDENLEIAEDIQLGENEYLLYTNYFGIKDRYVEQVANRYGDYIIIDNAQALYCPAYAKHQIYSPRKFMGMPDGGLAVTTVANYSEELPQGLAYDRCNHLLKRTELIPSEGYNDFKEVSHQIALSQLSKMSEISMRIFMSVDLEFIKEQRQKNFKQLHMTLSSSNKLGKLITDSIGNSCKCPLAYPYLTDDKKLKSKLIKEQIFVATYWPNVIEWTNSDMLENNMANCCLAIPCDQRHCEDDMNRIIKTICK